MDQLEHFIGTLGFPIFVAAWLLLRDFYFLRVLERHMQHVEDLLSVIAAQKEEQ